MPRNTDEEADYAAFGPEYVRKIEELEHSAREKVSDTLSAIDAAVASFEAAKPKPAALKKRIERLRRIGRALESWERESLRAGGSTDIASRIKRLRRFTEICDSLG